MPIAYFAGRLAEMVVECCGGSKETARMVSMGASCVLGALDPLGAIANMGHVSAKFAADDGSEVGKAIDNVMNVGSLLVAAPDALLGLGKSACDCAAVAKAASDVAASAA